MLGIECKNAIQNLVNTLTAQGQTLATAESCTGGLLGAAITAIPGTSAVYLGGVNAYANKIKERALGVAKDTMIQHGSVSTAVAQEMARGVVAMSGADWGLAITGVAGPNGGTATKPVGYVCLCIQHANGFSRAWDVRVGGTRTQIREAAVYEATVALAGALVVEEAGAP